MIWLLFSGHSWDVRVFVTFPDKFTEFILVKKFYICEDAIETMGIDLNLCLMHDVSVIFADITTHKAYNMSIAYYETIVYVPVVMD